MDLKEIVRYHAELKLAIQDINGGLVQPRDDVVAAMLLMVHQNQANTGLIYQQLLEIDQSLQHIGEGVQE